MCIYESHMGGLYYNEEPLDYEFIYCETCGDYDSFLGNVDTEEEAWELLKNKIDRLLEPGEEGYGEVLNTGGYGREEVEEFIGSIPF